MPSQQGSMSSLGCSKDSGIDSRVQWHAYQYSVLCFACRVCHTLLS
jgi:hypothetical protein